MVRFWPDHVVGGRSQFNQVDSLHESLMYGQMI